VLPISKKKKNGVCSCSFRQRPSGWLLSLSTDTLAVGPFSGWNPAGLHPWEFTVSPINKQSGTLHPSIWKHLQRAGQDKTELKKQSRHRRRQAGSTGAKMIYKQEPEQRSEPRVQQDTRQRVSGGHYMRNQWQEVPFRLEKNDSLPAEAVRSCC
jgi:hypothetical protein